MINERKIDIIKNSRPFKIADVVVFALVAALIITLLFTVYSGGDTVRISYEGASADYSLNIDREIIIEDKLVIVIRDGGVYVKESTCPDRVCIHSGVIKRRNQMLVCAPYGIVLTIITRDDRWV